MSEPHVLRLKDLPVFDRCTGIRTQLFSSKELCAQITSGITRYLSNHDLAGGRPRPGSS